MNQKVIIFDTTLRDGEQSLQKSLNVQEKLEIAFALEKLGIDVIEVGFPISSPGDFQSVKVIASRIKNVRICSLARCVQKDIDLAAKAMKKANDFRIHLFLGTSNLHITSKLKKNFEDIIEMAVYFIKYAKKYSNDIEFSCEDAGRTSINNLCKIVYESIKAGANTINIPDTVGYTIPSQFSKIIRTLYDRVSNIQKAIISVHCHNDLGMAVGNSISAIEAGARQVEGTINGIGERAGNAALEELMIAIKVKQKLLGIHTNINYKEIYQVSQKISQICNIPIASNKAIVGSNAFSHSSGIHQDGMLKNRKNYEILEPQTIGLQRIEFNLTSRSGRAAVKYHMQKMGYSDVDYNLNELYENFLKLADKRGQVFNYELEALAFVKEPLKDPKHFKLKFLNIQLQSNESSAVIIMLTCGNILHTKTLTIEKNLIDTIFKILKKITEYPITLKFCKLTTIKEKLNNSFFNHIDIEIDFNKRMFRSQFKESQSDIPLFIANSFINILNSIWRSNQVSIYIQNLYKNKKITIA